MLNKYLVENRILANMFRSPQDALMGTYSRVSTNDMSGIPRSRIENVGKWLTCDVRHKY